MCNKSSLGMYHKTGILDLYVRKVVHYLPKKLKYFSEHNPDSEKKEDVTQKGIAAINRKVVVDSKKFKRIE